MSEERLATELLHELKATSKRWFIIALVEFIALVLIIVIYLVVPEESTSTIVEQDADNTQNTQMIGGDFSGQSTPDSQENLCEESK